MIEKERINVEATVKSLIPHGIYCYEYRDEEFILCPFWSKNHLMPEQENGYCSFLSMADWYGEGQGLLWDQVKECGINEDLDN